MKMSVVLDRTGEVIAAQEATTRTGGEAGLVAGPGQKLQEVEVPQGFKLDVKDPASFQKELARLVKARTA